jgi:hypothetical protein
MEDLIKNIILGIYPDGKISNIHKNPKHKGLYVADLKDIKFNGKIGVKFLKNSFQIIFSDPKLLI